MMRILRIFLMTFTFLTYQIGFSQSSEVQYEKYGDYNVPKLADWIYLSEKSNGDYYVFQYKSGEIELGLRKQPFIVQTKQEFNAKIMVIINGLGQNKEFNEQRKQSSPLSFLGLTSSHQLNIKSRETGQRRFLYHPLRNTEMYEISVFERSQGLNPGDASVQLLSLIYLSSDPDGKAIAAAATSKVDKLRPINTKVQSPPKGQKEDKELEKNKKVQSSDEEGEVLADNTGDIVFGDETEPLILLPTGNEAISDDAGWLFSVLNKPEILLDALDGDRPGGEVNTMIALLEQLQGPIDESEEEALYKHYLPHADMGSPNLKKNITAQNQQLLRTLLYNQLMMEAAWEYDFATSSYEVAKMMEDEEEMELELLVGQMQEFLMEQQNEAFQAAYQENQKMEEIPSPELIISINMERRQEAINVAAAVYGMTAEELMEKTIDKEEPKPTSDPYYPLVRRYFAIRDEMEVLQELCAAGSDAACEERHALYEEAMKIRKSLEEKGIDVLNYKPKEEKETKPQGEIPKLEPFFDELPSRQDPSLTQEQNEAIAEHEFVIASLQKHMAAVYKEMNVEKDPNRLEQLRLQALHMAQDIHDSNDLIESIRTGSIVKTRGPWNEHAAMVLAETSRKMRQEAQRINQLQASYARLLKTLEKYDYGEAMKWSDQMSKNVVDDIYKPGGFEKAKAVLEELHKVAKEKTLIAQGRLEQDQAKAFELADRADRDLRYIEKLKAGCDGAIFVGSFFTGMGVGLAISMLYEGSVTSVEKSPTEALKNAAYQGAFMLTMHGAFKGGGWVINKLRNPKIPAGKLNQWKDVVDAHKFKQEMEWNQALVNNLKNRVKDYEVASKKGMDELVKARKALDEAVNAANSSALSKRIMKNELTALQNSIKSGATKDYSKLRECINYQNVTTQRLEVIYARTDDIMLKELSKQGYNIQPSWLKEFRNSTSIGINADRDLGLLASAEKFLKQSGKPVSMHKFMKDAQKSYGEAYRKITGRSAALADHSITTSAHSESFPLSWLQQKLEGPFTTINPPVSPGDFSKAGKAIYNKVTNALSGSDSRFSKMQKACASLSKDLETKVLGRIANPPAGSKITKYSQQAASEYWGEVNKVLSQFSKGQSDPLSTMRELKRLTGSSSISEAARGVEKLLNNLAPTR